MNLDYHVKYSPMYLLPTLTLRFSDLSLGPAPPTNNIYLNQAVEKTLSKEQDQDD